MAASAKVQAFVAGAGYQRSKGEIQAELPGLSVELIESSDDDGGYIFRILLHIQVQH